MYKYSISAYLRSNLLQKTMMKHQNGNISVHNIIISWNDVKSASDVNKWIRNVTHIIDTV